ncbi:MAG: hypothetical protein MZV70_18000 [Desulfobacterales bacterium]|nr:hypothetical protein [Desulfobacterales bacterium]
MSAITKDAVRLALFDGRDRVSQSDIELAFQEQAMGLENPVEEMEEDQRRQIAYHEAGHAIVQYYLRPDERIVRASIVRRSEALGYVLPVPNYDIYALPLRTFVADILVSMAGHVAAKLFLGEYWTGATGDFQNVPRPWQFGALRLLRSAAGYDAGLEHGQGQGRVWWRSSGTASKARRKTSCWRTPPRCMPWRKPCSTATTWPPRVHRSDPLGGWLRRGSRQRVAAQVAGRGDHHRREEWQERQV